MKRPEVLAIVLAGGTGGRLEVLTQRRAKPAMPYAGVYRLIDFPLSNCMHSRIRDVWVVEQYEAQSLNDQLVNGRPWDLDRTRGGPRLLPPQEGGDAEGFDQGNAQSLHRNRTLIREFDPDMLLVLSADHVYKLDYNEVIDRHLELEADATLVTTTVPSDEAASHGVVEVQSGGRVTGFESKPEEPKSDLVTTEVFVYNPARLLETLEELVRAGGEDELGDFGDALLPRLVEEGRVFEHRLEGYWKDVGTPENYWRSHMDLLDPDSEFELDEPSWPILTLGVQRPPARVHGTARIDNSLISPGCTIRGEVARSVLSPGVVVEEGAVVRDSILLHETVVSSGARVGARSSTETSTWARMHGLVSSATRTRAHPVRGASSRTSCSWDRADGYPPTPPSHRAAGYHQPAPKLRIRDPRRDRMQQTGAPSPHEPRFDQRVARVA